MTSQLQTDRLENKHSGRPVVSRQREMTTTSLPGFVQQHSGQQWPHCPGRVLSSTVSPMSAKSSPLCSPSTPRGSPVTCSSGEVLVWRCECRRDGDAGIKSSDTACHTSRPVQLYTAPRPPGLVWAGWGSGLSPFFHSNSSCLLSGLHV